MTESTVFVFISVKTEIARSVKRTKITRAPCRRRRIGGTVLRAENVDDFRTWPPNGSSHIREKQNFLRKHKGACKKFLEPERKPKVIYTDNSLEFGKACEDLSCDCWKSSGQSKGTSAVLLQSGLDEIWWADSVECYTYLRNIQDLLSDGEPPFERRFGKPFKGPIIPFGSLFEYHPMTAKDQSRIHPFGKKVLPGMFLGYALYAGWIWKGDVLVADIEELETMDASEIYSKRLNAKEVIFRKENGKFIFPVADGRIKTPGGDQELRTSTLVWESPIRGESRVDFLGESEGSLPPPQDSLLDAGEAMNDFWSMSGNFICRHHVETRVKVYSPREESFLIPLKYIDVSRTSHTNLDVMQERRIDAPHRWLLEHRWAKRFVWFLDTFHSVNSISREKLPYGYMWYGERLTRKQPTSRPDHLWPELWTKLGRNAQLKERQKWSREKRKLDNARKLRGIYFIDHEDKKFKETIKNARNNLETPMAPALPCKTSKEQSAWVTRSKTNEIKSKLACILEASESTRLRMGESLPNHHEDHIAAKGDNSLQHFNFVHKFILVLQAMKIPAAKAAVDQEWEKLEKILAWDLTKVRSNLPPETYAVVFFLGRGGGLIFMQLQFLAPVELFFKAVKRLQFFTRAEFFFTVFVLCGLSCLHFSSRRTNSSTILEGQMLGTVHIMEGVRVPD